MAALVIAGAILLILAVWLEPHIVELKQSGDYREAQKLWRMYAFVAGLWFIACLIVFAT